MTVEQRFAEMRPRLLRLAYSELGDLSEAEDVVQEAWLRLERTGADRCATSTVADPSSRAWRWTRCVRPGHDGRVRRPLAAEPLLSSSAEDPADRVTWTNRSVRHARAARAALPAERTAFVLHDVFDVPFDEVAEVVGRKPEAVRQLASRARRHIAQQRPRFPATRPNTIRRARVRRRDRRRRPRRADHGARPGRGLDHGRRWPCHRRGKPLQGADRVARAWLALRRKPAIVPAATPVAVDGRLGLTIAGTDGHPMVVSFAVEQARITRIDAVRNPDKVQHALARARS